MLHRLAAIHSLLHRTPSLMVTIFTALNKSLQYASAELTARALAERDISMNDVNITQANNAFGADDADPLTNQIIYCTPSLPTCHDTELAVRRW